MLTCPTSHFLSFQTKIDIENPIIFNVMYIYLSIPTPISRFSVRKVVPHPELGDLGCPASQAATGPPLRQ